MDPARDYEREVEQLQKRLTHMGKAFVQINENLDFTAVLQSVLDSARSLTEAGFGMMTRKGAGRSHLKTKRRW